MNLISRIRRHWFFRYLKLALGVLAAILAVSFVTSVMVDLGPSVRNLAETQGSKALKRPIHIGRLGIRLFLGRFIVEDFSIEGLAPTDQPFFTAKHLELSLDWSTLLRREVTITAVDMTDWKMLVERWNDRQNFPKFTSDEPGGPRRFTTTLKYLRAWRGQFTFQDHDAPWSVVAPNIDITMGNLPKYHGTASFSGGTVAIQQYQPFSASMNAEFVLDGPHVRLERIDMDTDGAKTIATGEVELGSLWPEQQYQFKSHVQFPRMRRIFFKDEKWDLSGDGDVAGTFHLFKNGRDLTANFSSPVLGVNEFRFPGLYGSVHWTPDLLDVTDAGAKFFGGDARFSYSLKPLGSRTPTVARFDTSFENADLRSFTEFEQLAKIGRAHV